jgi:hypothetical protein
MLDGSTQRSRHRGAVTLATILLTILASGVLVLLSPVAVLGWKRHRVRSFCASVVPGDSLDQVERRGFDQGLIQFLGLTALQVGPNDTSPPFIVASKSFLFAHLNCVVTGDAQRTVVSATYDELW